MIVAILGGGSEALVFNRSITLTTNKDFYLLLLKIKFIDTLQTFSVGKKNTCLRVRCTFSIYFYPEIRPLLSEEIDLTLCMIDYE